MKRYKDEKKIRVCVKYLVPSRFFNKVGYSRCSPMYGKCRLNKIDRKNPHMMSLIREAALSHMLFLFINAKETTFSAHRSASRATKG